MSHDSAALSAAAEVGSPAIAGPDLRLAEEQPGGWTQDAAATEEAWRGWPTAAVCRLA